jgi:uncharacterized protein (TIGR02001 family)
VTAPAEAGGCRARGRRTSFAFHTAAFLLGCWAAPASAQIAAAASVFTDARFRGYSLSGGRPVAILDFAYDDPSGFYADVAGSGVLRRGGDPAPLGLQLTGGYAKRLKSGTTVDFGISHSSYSHYSGSGQGRSYSEVYAGIARGAFSSRIFLSPHYFATGHWTAYGEINATVSPARRWSVDGHVGVLVPLRTHSGERYRRDCDWRIGLSRQLGRVSLRAAWSGGSSGYDFYNERRHHRSALVLGATWAL